LSKKSGYGYGYEHQTKKQDLKKTNNRPF